MCRARQESYLDAERHTTGEENTRNMGRTGLNFALMLRRVALFPTHVCFPCICLEFRMGQCFGIINMAYCFRHSSRAVIHIDAQTLAVR